MRCVKTPHREVLLIPEAWTVWQHHGQWFTILDGVLFKLKPRVTTALETIGAVRG